MDFVTELRILCSEFDLKNSAEETLIDHLSQRTVSVAGFLEFLLQHFVSVNFLGGSVDIDLEIDPELSNVAAKELTVEGERPFRRAKCLELLWLCSRLARYMCQITRVMVFPYLLFSLKCLYLHQYLLGQERSAKLHTDFNDLLGIADEKVDLADIHCQTDVVCFLIIASYLNLFYYHYDAADEMALKCASYLGVSVRFAGALGKRTKFQETDVANLLVRVDSTKPVEHDEESMPSQSLPKDIPLPDDGLLNSIAFADGETGYMKSLSLCEQGLLLLLCEIYRLSHPNDEITVEQRVAYLTLVLRQAYPDKQTSQSFSSWPIATEALFHRSIIENDSTRRLERSIAQIEELCDQFVRKKPNCTERGFESFFLSRMPSIWGINLMQAQLMKKIGCHKTALDIYLRWDQWFDIIECYTLLNKREKAEEAIRAQIDSGDHSPELYCALGDVTNNREHYEKAWEISEHKSARAMRSLAVVHMYVDKDYVKAIECFEKSLNINSFQVKLWFTFGCCCLQAKEFAKAESAFRRCVQLEPDNYEAWNNCASAALLRGKKDVAFHLLKEACKWNFESWRVWENLCAVSADVGAFTDTIRACHRLLDLKHNFSDADVLRVLCKAVLENITDHSGTPASGLRSKVLELFGRVTASTANVAEIWECYAELLFAEKPLQITTYQRAVRNLQAAHRCRIQLNEGNWERSSEKRDHVIHGLERLVQIVSDPPVLQGSSEADATGNSSANEDKAQVAFIQSTLASLRLSVLSIVGRLKRAEQTVIAGDQIDQLVKFRERCEQLLDSVVKLLSSETESTDT